MNATYIVHDTDKFKYKLPGLIKNNYVSLIGAHSASFIRIETMIRLDDYKYDEEKKRQQFIPLEQHFSTILLLTGLLITRLMMRYQ